MILHGIVINRKDKIDILLDRCKEIASNNKLKFKKVEREDYSWKIDGFDRIVFYFSSLPKKIEFLYLLDLFKEITLKYPSSIELKIGIEWTVNIYYSATIEELENAKNDEVFAIFNLEKCNDNNIVIKQEDLESIYKCNELWRTQGSKKEYENHFDLP